jgi:hypothetical protein
MLGTVRFGAGHCYNDRGALQRRADKERGGCATRRAPLGVRYLGSFCAGTCGSQCVGG